MLPPSYLDAMPDAFVQLAQQVEDEILQDVARRIGKMGTLTETADWQLWRYQQTEAVRALLDLDALKGSKDRSADIDKALDDAAKANPWAFGEDGAAGVAVVSTGAEHGAPPANESNGVEAAFKSLNPELNL